MRRLFGWLSRRRWFVSLPIVLIAGLAVYLGISSLLDWANSTSFCGTTCHVMKPEYTAYQQSFHARVRCADCHVGPGLWAEVEAKRQGLRELWLYVTNTFERPIPSPVESLRPARDTCEQCHWPELFYNDRAVEIPHFAEDEANSRTNTYMLVRIGGGTERQGQGRGIHWHIQNVVEYIATDPQRQEIPWVRAQIDGQTITYIDAAQPLSEADLREYTPRVMDCIDCHNRATHIFQSATMAVEEAMANGVLPADLPHLRQQAVAVMGKEYASEDEALAAIAGLADWYRANHGTVYSQRSADIARSVEILQGIYRASHFPEYEVTPQTYPDNVGHDESPGCFRCHDGKHLAADGSSIRLHCNICHTIPQTVAAGQPPPAIPLQPLAQPDSHLASNWMAEHRSTVDQSCSSCHQMQTFCANPNCHGRAWPYVGLSVVSPPYPLPEPAQPSPTPAVLPEAVQRGAALYARDCAVCHRQPAALQLDDVEEAVRDGKKGMPSFPYTAAELSDTVAFVAWAIQHPAEPPPQGTPGPAPAEQQLVFADRWAGSGHADGAAEAFSHWNEDDPKEVPVGCAKCHSTPGYLDFLGADGSAAGIVDRAARVGTVITCLACHNDVVAAKSSVVFPSGAEIAGLGPEARCMECHQGRASLVQVNDAIAGAGVPDDDTVNANLRFTNIHYYAAAATVYGTLARGGYQYDGQTYDGKLAHVDGYNTCVGCHDAHSLQVKVVQCAACHSGVTRETLVGIRMAGSMVDYDGNGDTTEGIAAEMDGLQAMLLQAMRSYASEVAGAPIAYSGAAYPYFFADANDNGTVDEGETGYASWTGRLLKAAYNYQLSVKDPGAFAHGGKYVIELLYDSIADLNTRLASPVDLGNARRIDAGHFAGSAEAFRHWDAEGEVPAGCVKCHTGVGLPMFLKNGATIAVEPSNGLLCTTCHDGANWPARYVVDTVTFPSGKRATFGEGVGANLCLNCHQGRESTASVKGAVRGMEDDTPSADLRFRNVHYFAAGATLFGGDVQGAYEYEGQTYIGRNAHVAGFDTCTGCHNAHSLAVNVQACGGCHQGVATLEDLATIRMSDVDYDGDGLDEGIAGEVATYQENLLAAIQEYAEQIAGAPIRYDADVYPYFSGADGKAYAAWTPRLLRAAYNYQYSQKDPGAFAHNGKYMIQAMYDSLVDLGTRVTVDMAGMTRP